jgi:hypothetical protein
LKFIDEILSDLRKVDQSPKELRKFAVITAIILFLLGMMIWFKHRHEIPPLPGSVVFFIGAAVIFLILAVISPRILKPLNTAMMFVGMSIGWVLTRTILIILFCLIFFPIGLILRISGHDSMNRRFNPKEESYWIARPQKPFDPEQCKHLF